MKKALSIKQQKHLAKLAKIHKGVPKSQSHRMNQSNALKGKFKGKKNFNYKDGRTNKIYYCPFCGKLLSSYQAKMCLLVPANNKKGLIKDQIIPIV